MFMYSLHNQRPTPLPFRITLPNGFTRTDPATFTPEEIQAAGFIGPYFEPPYDPLTQQLDWIDGEYVVSPVTPPQPAPRWLEFGSAVQTNLEINGLLTAALNSAPALAMALSVGLSKAADGDFQVFQQAWQSAKDLGLVGAELVQEIQMLCTRYDLPAEFVEGLG